MAKRINKDDSVNFCPFCGSKNFEFQEGAELPYYCYDCESSFGVSPDGILNINEALFPNC